MLDLFYTETEGKDVLPFIIHANNYEAMDIIKKDIKEKRPDIKEIAEMPLTAVVGAHGGPKTIGLGYYIKK